MTSTDRPNVVVLVQDSVRHDRTSLGGHSRDTTPELASLAARADARHYEHAVAHARYTLPSSASILTGTSPSVHDVGFGRSTLDDTIPTVAEAFRDAGYATALVSNNYFVSSDTHLTRGFEEYTRLPKSPLGILETVGIGTTLRWLGQLRKHSAGFELDKHRHSGAYLMASLVEDELDRLAADDDPFFLYAHFNQPHRPYYPPLAWFERYADEFEMSVRDAGDFSMEVHRNLVEKVARGCPFTDDEWRVLGALYDAQIEYTDTFVGDMFEHVETVTDDTVFVVTADHGEHLGERGALGHKYALDDALLNVPLLTVGLDVPETTDLVQHTDVMRTLLETAGARSAFVDGVDLRSETRDVAVSEDVERSLDPLHDVNPDFDASQFFPEADDGLPARTSLRTKTHRYVRGDDGTDVLYELPDETTNVAGELTDLLADLRAQAEAWLEDRVEDRTDDETTDEALPAATKDRLMNMGYLEDEL